MAEAGGSNSVESLSRIPIKGFYCHKNIVQILLARGIEPFILISLIAPDLSLYKLHNSSKVLDLFN